MGKSLTRKIIESHFVSGSMVPGEEVFLHVDQTLTHDINAVMTYLAFEAVGLPRVRTECSVSYLDQIPTRKVTVKNVTKHFEFEVTLDLTDNEIDVVLCGGQLRYLKKQLAKMEEN